MSLPVSELPALHTTGTFPELAVYNHGLRMDAVIHALSTNGIRSVIDLGCGDGALLKKMLASDLELCLYVGLDTWHERLDLAESDADVPNWVSFLPGSMTNIEAVIADPEPYRRLGAVVLLETIEHVPRDQVCCIEDGVFEYVEPDIVVVTTPDATKRLNDEQLRARGHYYEWDIPEFEDWANSVCNQYPDYSVDITQLTGPTFVRNTQIAVFSQT